MGKLVIFVMRLLNNSLVKVTETFTNILNYYVLQTTANKIAAYVIMYVVKKYLKNIQCLQVSRQHKSESHYFPLKFIDFFQIYFAKDHHCETSKKSEKLRAVVMTYVVSQNLNP